MKRNTPCTECRQLRRKCTFPNNSNICLRCSKLNKVCIQTKNNSEAEDNDSEVENLQNTVRDLEWTILQLEDQISSFNDQQQQKQQQQKPVTIKKPLARLKNNYETQQFLEAMIKSLMFTWKIEIKDGVFQIETGIRNVEDLLRFQFNNNFRYLSPFSNMNNGYSSKNNTTDNYRGSSGAIIRFGQQLIEGSDPLPFTVKLLTLCARKSHPIPEALSLPSELLLNPQIIMDQLIEIYFMCHSGYAPMVHEKVFMSKYNLLEDPFLDPLALSLCAYVCSTPCDHLYYTSKERRDMSDYFFLKAKNIILDQFDDPNKRLENVMCINTLTKYMQVTLKFKECRELNMIAYQICLDLNNEYQTQVLDKFPDNRVNVGAAEHPFGSEAYMKCHDIALYSRNVASTFAFRRLMDYISNNVIDDSLFTFPRWFYFEDESEQTKRFVQCQNWVLGIFNHPYIGHIMNQIMKIHVGQICSLTFESIVRLEDVIYEWFNCIPTELRISTDYRSEATCKKDIDQITDSTLLVTFLQFNLFLVSIYASLIQPIALGENNDQLLPIIQRASLEKTLKGCRLLIHTVNRLFELKGASECQYTSSGCDFLFHTIDVLLMLSLSRNSKISRESITLLRNCLNDLDNNNFIRQHRVPSHTSPIHNGLIDLENPTFFHLDYYDKCPQPWFSMVYDASRFVAFKKMKK